MKYTSAKKYAAAKKSAYAAKKSTRKGTSYYSKKGIVKSRNYPKTKMGLVRTVESIVRSMGPPRNVAIFESGVVTSAQGVASIRNGCMLLSMTAQGAFPIAPASSGVLANNASYCGVFPNTTNQTFNGQLGLGGATTNEYFMKKMKSRVILQPAFITLAAAQQGVSAGSLKVQPIQGFRVIFFAQRRDLDSQSQQQNGLKTGWGSDIATVLERYGAPTVYTQLFNPQFFTHFRVLSDKVHKVFNPTIWDGTQIPTANQLGTLTVPSAVVSDQSNLMLDFNTYVNKKLVNVQVNENAQIVASDYPQNFPPEAKTFLLILPIIGTTTSAGQTDSTDFNTIGLQYSVSTQTYAHFRDI